MVSAEEWTGLTLRCQFRYLAQIARAIEGLDARGTGPLNLDEWRAYALLMAARTLTGCLRQMCLDVHGLLEEACRRRGDGDRGDPGGERPAGLQ